MIDTHVHADSRSSEDFRDMYLAGIDTAITCSFYPYKANEEILLNHLNRILEFDTKRASKYGLDLKVALGIHPTNSIEKPFSSKSLIISSIGFLLASNNFSSLDSFTIST